jgi:hypothetical protein
MLSGEKYNLLQMHTRLRIITIEKLVVYGEVTLLFHFTYQEMFLSRKPKLDSGNVGECRHVEILILRQFTGQQNSHYIHVPFLTRLLFHLCSSIIRTYIISYMRV